MPTPDFRFFGGWGSPGPTVSLEADPLFPLNCLDLSDLSGVGMTSGPPVSFRSGIPFPLNRLDNRPKVREAPPISQSQQAPTHGFRFIRGAWGLQASQLLSKRVSLLLDWLGPPSTELPGRVRHMDDCKPPDKDKSGNLQLWLYLFKYEFKCSSKWLFTCAVVFW